MNGCEERLYKKNFECIFAFYAFLINCKRNFFALHGFLVNHRSPILQCLPYRTRYRPGNKILRVYIWFHSHLTVTWAVTFSAKRFSQTTYGCDRPIRTYNMIETYISVYVILWDFLKKSIDCWYLIKLTKVQKN